MREKKEPIKNETSSQQAKQKSSFKPEKKKIDPKKKIDDPSKKTPNKGQEQPKKQTTINTKNNQPKKETTKQRVDTPKTTHRDQTIDEMAAEYLLNRCWKDGEPRAFVIYMGDTIHVKGKKTTMNEKTFELFVKYAEDRVRIRRFNDRCWFTGLNN